MKVSGIDYGLGSPWEIEVPDSATVVNRGTPAQQMEEFTLTKAGICYTVGRTEREITDHAKHDEQTRLDSVFCREEPAQRKRRRDLF